MSVQAWLQTLKTSTPPASFLSDAGARAVLDAAVDAIVVDLDAIPRRRPFPRATFVAAGTVLTAPLEFLAVLLHRGSEVLLKHPHGDPGWAEWFARTAADTGLPLRATADRSAVEDRDLVVVMGSDETVDAVRATSADGVVLGFGHRFGAASVTDPLNFAAIAADAALHDGRGCMSPVVVFSQHPDALDLLAAAMADAEARWPRGTLHPSEGAALRARRALARVVGEVREGPGWSVHQLPPDRLEPVALPRSIVLVDAVPALGPWQRWLGTWAEDTATGVSAPRVCKPGEMQHPPLLRKHDGVDWLALEPADADSP